MPVANIDEAIQRVNRLVADNGATQNDALTALDAWAQIFAPTFSQPFNSQSVSQRAVLDWQVPTAEVRARLAALASYAVQVDAEPIIDAVFRTLQAVKYARLDGLITVAQENAVVAQFNVAYP